MTVPRDALQLGFGARPALSAGHPRIVHAAPFPPAESSRPCTAGRFFPRGELAGQPMRERTQFLLFHASRSRLSGQPELWRALRLALSGRHLPLPTGTLLPDYLLPYQTSL